jgi:hypothetical protein
VNAAFLLVTTAWFAGDVPAPAPNACCGTTSCESCEKSGPTLLERLRACFHHKKEADCCDACPAPKCPAPAPKCEPKCVTTCDPCAEKKSHPWFKKKSDCDTCAPATCAPATCDSCEKSGPSLLERLRACFHHKKEADCCDSCASGTCGGTVVMPKAGEVIPVQPKKMPNPSKEPPSKEVRIDAPPVLAPVAPAIQAAPITGQPAIVPSVESETLRNPF